MSHFTFRKAMAWVLCLALLLGGGTSLAATRDTILRVSDNLPPVVATITGDTATYGTLQKLQDRDEKTTLEDAKKEAQNVIDEKGQPSWEYELKCGDIPWVHKGDRINVSVGMIYETMMLILGIDRTISDKEKTMTLTMEAVKKDE